MKRTLLIGIVVGLMAPLTFAQTCPEQQWLDPADYDVDPNIVVTDPNSGQLGLLRVERAYVGEPTRVCFGICDEDIANGDETWDDLIAYIDETEVPISADGQVTLERTFTSIGDHPVTLVVKNHAKTVAGTVVYRAFQPHAPVISFCGGGAK